MGRKEEPKKSLGREGKREKLLGEKKKIPSWKIISIALVMAALPFAWLILRDAPQAGGGKISGSQIAGNINYQKQSISMTKVAAVVGKGLVEVPVELVIGKKLVYFEYEAADGRIPLLAYMTPSGKLVTAVAVCEPCNSTSFHIEGNEMVCNACFTRWDLETLKGISGGCLTYPPDVIAHAVDSGLIKIKETDLRAWKPRVLRG